MVYKNIHTCNNQIKIDKNYLQNTSTKFFISHEILHNGMKFIKNIASNKQADKALRYYSCCNITVVTTSWMLCVSQKG